ncbi:hypothetical protein LTS18_011222, partial [Coniosporium uncinatum]
MCYSPVSEATRWNGASKKDSKSNAKADIIGVWRDGKTQWRTRVWSDSSASLNTMGTNTSNALRGKPKLSVVVPNGQPQPVPAFLQSSINPAPSATSQSTQEQLPFGCISKTTTITVKSHPAPIPNDRIPIVKTTTVRVTTDAPGCATPQARRPYSMLATKQFSSLNEVVRSDRPEKQRASLSDTSESSVLDDDNASAYSKRSSASSRTSQDTHNEVKPVELPERSSTSIERNSSTTYSVQSPVNAGVFDDGSSVGTPDHPAELVGSIVYTRSVKSTPASPLVRRTSRRRMSSRRSRSLLLTEAYQSMSARPSSCTWSEAEKDLDELLTAIGEEKTFVEIKGLPASKAAAPAIPPKSKRRSIAARPAKLSSTMQPMPMEKADCQLQRNVSVADSVSRMSMGDNMNYERSAVAARMAEQERNISAQAAETIILRIMENLNGLDDLLTTAVVNKGFYRVFKRHELRLMRKTLRNQSPPAWEYRETALTTVTDGSETPNEDRPTPEYTPQKYYECYKRDCTVIDMLKKLFMQHCKSFLRVSTVAALASKDPAKSVRVDAALW